MDKQSNNTSDYNYLASFAQYEHMTTVPTTALKVTMPAKQTYEKLHHGCLILIGEPWLPKSILLHI